MIEIKAPASSGNMGPGFDCMGMAFDVYNTFLAERNDTLLLEGCEERFNNEDNLFAVAYQRGCQAIGVTDNVHAVFQCGIPVSRGMGSSAAMIAGGLYAASALHGNALTQDQIFQIASEMEGHPDNAAPCIFGSLSASAQREDGSWIHRLLPVHESWLFTYLIPDFEVTTAEARKILPPSYSRHDAAMNAGHAVLMARALQDGDGELLKTAAVDHIHEPYRSQLIHGYSQIRELTETDTGGKMIISGSGSTCLLIHQKPLSGTCIHAVEKMEHHWRILPVRPAEGGTLVREAVHE